MINFIKRLFGAKPDNNRDEMRKNFDGNFKKFDDMEQAALLLRLSGFTREETSEMLGVSMKKTEALETSIITKMKERK